MMERVLEFSNRVTDARGRAYGARVEGERRTDGRWEGRVVFVPVEEGGELHTERETLQSDVSDLRYWAAGLTHAYLEGALGRAQEQARLRSRGEWRTPLSTAVERFAVECLDDRVPAELMGTFGLEPGIARDLPDGSRLRYQGTTYGDEDGPRTHRFELQPSGEPDVARGWVRERLAQCGSEARFER